MDSRLALLAMSALLALRAQPLAAQADEHARAMARDSCERGKQSPEVLDATAALQGDPDELGPRLRLADALVDQGCYQEAVSILEAGQEAHPRNAELAGKLRDVRSLVTEQTYIQGLTQAAETARFQRNQLRCTRLADLTACDDALSSHPDDPQLQKARQDAIAHQSAEIRQESTVPPAATAQPAEGTAFASSAPAAKSFKPRKRPAKTNPAAAAPLVASVAAAEPLAPKVFSNDAPPGQTN